ncbi:hypothetical protein GCM10010096_22340 [Alcaligenes pakistanensis]|uniref:Uncharacterized protein n=1 Tax=Alcaligenes pakistanensis TaxID=1482717 RepID=A0A8H9M0T3_9BURK|nr:hypothetical protein GCM10010096_22340 [Alcaligenes pakistanensis]
MALDMVDVVAPGVQTINADFPARRLQGAVNRDLTIALQDNALAVVHLDVRALPHRQRGATRIQALLLIHVAGSQGQIRPAALAEGTFLG